MMEIFGPWSAARVVVAGLLLLTIGLGVVCLWAACRLNRMADQYLARALERERNRRRLP
ncbi:hypothetical protein [Stappia indica]|uniref:hypothetical protein n=1 Tax=Stappia indica TaxID=538381 RepID=UPI0014957A56|nr:hypothetical protein [Stappia indica]